jgi:LAO/AO transport system kinase
VRRPEQLIAGIVAGERRALARAITLAESSRPEHRRDALTVLDGLLPRTGQATRVGISGAPGVGKSTLIEALGRHVIECGHRVAVLAIDPSSRRSGGSILGDKTRMIELAQETAAFIRPSPSGGTLGGIARRTRDVMLLCESFGFDVVLIETVGVGQSETAAEDLVDVLVLLVQPGAGDELQGMKRGVIELADVVVVTKADGELAAAAARAVADYGNALHLLRPKHRGWQPPVLLTSALEGEGIAEVWNAIREHQDTLRDDGRLDARRAAQAKSSLWSELTDHLLAELQGDPVVAELLPQLEEDVAAGRRSPGTAARMIIEARQRAAVNQGQGPRSG